MHHHAKGRRTRQALPLLALTLLTACASPPRSGGLHGLDVELVTPTGAPAGTANCVIGNGEGTWTLAAPGRITVTTGAAPLQVRCLADDGRSAGEATARPGVTGSRADYAVAGAGGGLLFGGVIGDAEARRDRGDTILSGGVFRRMAVVAGAVTGALIGAIAGAAVADPAYVYPDKLRVVMQPR